MEITLMQPDHNLMDVSFRGTPDFPIQFSLDVLRDYQHSLIDWHWHPALEFSLVRHGQVRYYVENLTFDLPAGDGILKNANVLHRVEPHPQHPDGEMLSVFMDTEFIAPAKSLLHKQYVAPLISDSRLTGLPLRQEVPWQGKVLSHLAEACALSEEKTGSYALKIHCLMCEIWELLWTYFDTLPQRTPSPRDLTMQVRAKQMMAFIQEHYQEKLTLAQIAASASISKTACLSCFRQTLGISPMDYVLHYRLDCAAHLLSATAQNVSEISMACGFEDPSYFGKLFRRRTGLTPLQYRRHSREQLSSQLF